MSGAFLSMHRRHIVVYLPTCQPEDPGTRDASVQVGVTYEDKATQWEEREEADPSLDKPSGANTTGQAVRKGGEQTTPATGCPSAPTTPQRAVIDLLQWVRHVFSRPPHPRPRPSPAPVAEGKRGHVGTRLRGWGNHHDNGGGNESGFLRNDEGDSPPEFSMSVAFCPVHRRRIVVHLPTCQPEEEDPGSRDASVQVGVTCEDKATQWDKSMEADPSLDKSSGVNSKGPTARKGAEQETLATSCPLGPTSSRHAINHLLQWVRQVFTAHDATKHRQQRLFLGGTAAPSRQHHTLPGRGTSPSSSSVALNTSPKHTIRNLTEVAETKRTMSV
ncbi:UNVERIFIED_CONTAM: hypothetical protein K2H54_012893 [Gekko kuhli]